MTKRKQKPAIQLPSQKSVKLANKKKPAEPDNKRHKEDFERLLGDAIGGGNVPNVRDIAAWPLYT